MKMNFGVIMRQLALRHGEREALVNVERGRRYSFAEFHLLTNRIANAMRSTLSIAKGDRFLLILENDNLALMQFPTFLKQAGTAVMTNLRDSIDEQRWQAELTKPKVAFIETQLVDSHAAMLSQLECTVVAMDPLSAEQKLRFPEILCFAELIEQASAAESDVALDQERDIILMRFTGGTTGRSKCAAYTLDNWLEGRDSSSTRRATKCASPAPTTP